MEKNMGKSVSRNTARESVESSKVNHTHLWTICISFPGGSVAKESICQCRRSRFDPWVGKIPWRRKWQPLQYYCLRNPMDLRTWWAIAHGVARIRHDLATKPPPKDKQECFDIKPQWLYKQPALRVAIWLKSKPCFLMEVFLNGNMKNILYTHTHTHTHTYIYIYIYIYIYSF